jgi:formamidopyrimidine-DNA glycosylase
MGAYLRNRPWGHAERKVGLVPELPDVETFRRYLDATSLHQQIEEVDVESRQLLEGISVPVLRDGLRGCRFESTRRHGKYLFVRLDCGGWLVLHFGMTGNLAYFKDMAHEPEYDQLLISFENGYHLSYESQRKLGEVELIDDPAQFAADRDLGPDALEIDLPAFKKTFAGSRGMAKSMLMDQGKMAGIGNVYADEILFQAGVHPRARFVDLDEEGVERIFGAMKDVFQTAIDRQAVPEDFPESYIIPHRNEDGTCPKCGRALESVKASGRTAYYCPNRQGEA